MRRGFTLIELLVVIAIIAILAAILFPVFARARAKAEQASCLSNVKQITLGLRMYVQDYDQKYPDYDWQWYGNTGCAGDQKLIMWFADIYPYVKNAQIYDCPSNTRDVAIKGEAASCYEPNITGPINYGYNDWLGYRLGSSDYAASSSQFEHPSEIFTVGDCYDCDIGGNNHFTTDGIAERVAWASNVSQKKSPHSDGANCGFADGHAKWFKNSNCKEYSTGGPIRFWESSW